MAISDFDGGSLVDTLLAGDSRACNTMPGRISVVTKQEDRTSMDVTPLSWWQERHRLFIPSAPIGDDQITWLS